MVRLRIVPVRPIFYATCAVYAAVLLCLPLPALAVEPPTAAPSRGAAKQAASAAEHLRRAERARAAGRWAEAAEAYRAAWALDPRPEIAGELGAAEVALGRFRDGAEHLEMSLDRPGSLSADQRRRFAWAMAGATREVATVAVSTNPPSAEVWLDGRSLGQPAASYVVHLDPGRHTFRARLEGYQETTVTLDAEAGTAPTVSIPMEKPRPAPTAAPRSAPLECRPGEDCTGAVASTLRYIGFGVTGGALAAGVMMTIGARVLDTKLGERIADQRPDACWGKGTLQPCRDLTELRHTRDVVSSGAALGFIIAGAVGAVTVSSFWWAPQPGSKTRIGAAPSVARGHVGAAVHGHW